jgi:ABC-type uncharacterized transport system substrate-binding protein
LQGSAAQQAAMPVVGVLSPNALEDGVGRRSFIEGLAETGFAEERNVALDYRFAATMLLVAGDALFFTKADELVALAARYAVPAMYAFRATAMSGGLMSYGADENDAFLLGGVYVGRILNGEKPGDLPVQQSTKIRFVINIRTARALGITFPLMLLGRADEVIE